MAKIFLNEVLIISNIELIAGKYDSNYRVFVFGLFVVVHGCNMAREFRQELFYSSMQDMLPFVGCWS